MLHSEFKTGLKRLLSDLFLAAVFLTDLFISLKFDKHSSDCVQHLTVFHRLQSAMAIARRDM